MDPILEIILKLLASSALLMLFYFALFRGKATYRASRLFLLAVPGADRPSGRRPGRHQRKEREVREYQNPQKPSLCRDGFFPIDLKFATETMYNIR